jgi:hypothetical protein
MTIEAWAGASKARTIAVGLLALTLGQLVVGTFAANLTQFAGKGFGVRLVLYPVMMLFLPGIWWSRARRRRSDRAVAGPGSAVLDDAMPWPAFAWIMLPFLIDVTGNTLNLYDSISWWDDVNHLVNWLFLSLGTGLLLSRTTIRPRWALGLVIAGLGAILAIGWEVGEYYAFLHDSSELTTAYTDTLGDEVLGTLGACLAALIIVRRTGIAG